MEYYPLPNPTYNQTELDILELVVRGYTDKEIAMQLCIQENIVEDHIEMLRIKFHARTRQRLAEWAVERGFVEK